MNKIKVNIEDRPEIGKEKVKKIRAQGKMICCVYGKGMKTIPFTADYQEIYNNLFVHNGKNNVFTLTNGKKTIDAIPYEIQFHAISKKILHMDFLAIHENEKVRLKMAIKTKGTALGTKKGGTLDQKQTHVNVKVLPKDILPFIEVDVTNLDLGQALLIKDLVLPESAEVIGIEGHQRVFVIQNKK